MRPDVRDLFWQVPLGMAVGAGLIGLGEDVDWPKTVEYPISFIGLIVALCSIAYPVIKLAWIDHPGDPNE